MRQDFLEGCRWVIGDGQRQAAFNQARDLTLGDTASISTSYKAFHLCPLSEFPRGLLNCEYRRAPLGNKKLAPSVDLDFLAQQPLLVESLPVF
ncbi:hypothetical protein HPP92_026270 [Vanilla planifolia]|uniref:Uncharacterized protein n=1 Tax=Vanilla planifolia TaxID=51239 RepID=A0A835PHN6_VANPL|nr:hypothetical protein HPP92_026270 [Vanilla planifolia]